MYFDDFTVGDTYEFDSVELTKEDIVAFGKRYDPLPIHTGERSATETPFEGVIASGLQTIALSQRQIVENLFKDSHLIGGVGFDEVLFPNPARPGDTLTTTLEVVEKRPSVSDSSRGIVKLERTVVNQNNDTLLQAVNNVLFKRRRTQ